MSKSTLGRVLDAFETNSEPLTMAQIARDLDISPARLEGMVYYWVRKGKLREAAPYANCGSCGHHDGGCPYVMTLPRSYEVVADQPGMIALESVDSACCHTCR